MFDLSMAEIAVAGVVALVVIGPKELPVVLRRCGKWMRQLKALAAQFRQQFDMLDQEGEMAALKRDLQEQATYIEGDSGELYRSYDISDLLEERKEKPDPKKEPVVESAASPS